MQMLTPEILILCSTAATIAFVHTILGPDHYMPFVALGRARKWSIARTGGVTLACGVGHIIGSFLLGLAGIALGIQLNSLEWIEGVRGEMAAWALVAVGLLYLSWGLRQAYRNKPHAHWHSHGDEVHFHEHNHHGSHSHVHTTAEGEGASSQRGVTAWALFMVFIVGPCEPLIPVLMFPAARESWLGVFAVAGTYSLVTIVTMLAAVVLTLWGVRRIQIPWLDRFGHAIAGSVIMSCGLAVAVLGF